MRRRSEELNGKGIDRKEVNEFRNSMMSALEDKLESTEGHLNLSKLETSLIGKISDDKQEVLRLLQSV